MYELHKNDQYFFDEPTLSQLSRFVSGFSAPCCLCAPMLGRAIVEAGGTATILDIDERFASIPGYRRYDVYRPKWLGLPFGLIVCDPPFFKVSLSQLFSAVRVLARNDFRQPLLVSFLRRRAWAIVGTFAPFGLEPTGYRPTYQTVDRTERNEVEFFSNLSDEQIERLRAVDR